MSTPDPRAWLPALPLDGPTIRLDLLEHRHAADLLAAFDIDLYRHMVGGPPELTLAGFERDIDRMRALPSDIPYAIVQKSTGRAIGRTAFREISPTRRGLDIGRTWIARAHHGTGVNPEAKYLMLRHAFEQPSPPAQRVGFWTSVANEHSQRALAKLGATREGLLRRYAADPQRPEVPPKDIYIYSITADEWPRVRAGIESRLAPML